MIRLVALMTLALPFIGCRDPKPTRSSALPDNVFEDRPIVIREGQAVILMPESNKSLMIGASVANGRLSISEIDPKGRSFSVTWNDQESWETSVIDSQDDQTTTIIDKNGDGLPNLRAVTADGSLSRFRMEDPRWIELESKSESEQGAGSNGEQAR